MSKQQTIEQILQRTRGIPAGFLETFDEATLGKYLARLRQVKDRPVCSSISEQADDRAAMVAAGEAAAA